jgi:hypothetical protein
MITLKGNLTEHFTQKEYNINNSKDPFITHDAFIFALCLENFRVWVKRTMVVTSWFRSYQVNKKLGGISSSNHTKGTACDFHFKNFDVDRDRFIKYATKWAGICKARGKTGEAGLYSWGIHFGIQTETQELANNHKFYHWDCRTGTQINKPFQELNNL